MKLVIIAGGLGSRFIEETITKPKPMITIGDQPIILHIMKYYASYGVNEFIICTGYKGDLINSYFINFLENYSNIELDLKQNSVKILNKDRYNWKIKIIRSDEKTNTGGRLLTAKKYINSNENFFFTYGDGLSNINIKSQLNLYKKKNKICLITGVKY